MADNNFMYSMIQQNILSPIFSSNYEFIPLLNFGIFKYTA